jgi:hypothetical protein
LTAAGDAQRLYGTVAGWMLYIASVHDKRPPGSLVVWVGKEKDSTLSAYVDQRTALWLTQDAVEWSRPTGRCSRITR